MLDEVQDFLTTYSQYPPQLPIWLLPHQLNMLPLRLALAPYSHCTFLAPDQTPDQILEQILPYFLPKPTPQYHILLVDDDPLVLSQLTQQLSDIGMITTPLEDPLQFWSVLNDTQPDLLILDIEMPNLEGIELCRMVRRDRYWAQLPILFITSHQHPETLQRVYAAGADDYIPKPCSLDYLKTRILNRLQRQQTTQNSILKPLAPGGMASAPALQTFQRDLSLAQRHRQPYCLAVLMVQPPRSSTVTQKPSTIQAIAQRLQDHLRKEDLLLPMPPNTLLLGFYGLPAQQAKQRLERLMADVITPSFSRLTRSDDVTISAGYATFPDEGSSLPVLWHIAAQKLQQTVTEQVI
jgi:DNA-binding response OmpR family regulator